MIEQILPAVAVAVEAHDHLRQTAEFAEEERLIAAAVPKRRGEFVTGRWCARSALAMLGYPPGPIFADRQGAPHWPAGAVGSITHCLRPPTNSGSAAHATPAGWAASERGYAAAVVAKSPDLLSIGVDAEPNAVLPDGVLRQVSSAGELVMLAELADADPSTSWDRLLFSAKEAVYKAYYPLTHGWLDFADVELRFDAAAGSFVAAITPPDPAVAGLLLPYAPQLAFAGRYLATAELLLTSVCLPAVADR